MRISKLLPIIGIAIFLFILSRLDLAVVRDTLLGMDLKYFLAAIGVLVIDISIKAYKWRELIKPYKVDYNMSSCIRAWLTGFFVSMITPARVGDVVRAFVLKKDKKLHIGKALTTVVIDRVVDMVILFVLAIFGIIMLAQVYVVGGNLLWTVMLAFLVFIAVVLLFMKEKYVKRLLKPVFHIMVKQHKGIGFRASFEDFYAGVKILKRNWEALLGVTSLTLFIWFVTFFEFYFLALAIGLDVSYFFIALIMPSALLIEALPISFSGIGTREATLIAFMSLASIPASVAVSFSLMILFVNYIVALPGLYFWLKSPIEFM